MIRAVICDFGGVLTTPLIDSFLAYQRESGIAMEDLGKGMAKVMAEDGGRHPLFELEKGNMSEADFLRRLGDAIGQPLHSFRETYFANLEPNPGEPGRDLAAPVANKGAAHPAPHRHLERTSPVRPDVSTQGVSCCLGTGL